jgi:hypothetical protein
VKREGGSKSNCPAEIFCIAEQHVHPHVASTAVAAVVSGVAFSAEGDGIDQDGLLAGDGEGHQPHVARADIVRGFLTAASDLGPSRLVEHSRDRSRECARTPTLSGELFGLDLNDDNDISRR